MSSVHKNAQFLCSEYEALFEKGVAYWRVHNSLTHLSSSPLVWQYPAFGGLSVTRVFLQVGIVKTMPNPQRGGKGAVFCPVFPSNLSSSIESVRRLYPHQHIA